MTIHTEQIENFLLILVTYNTTTYTIPLSGRFLGVSTWTIPAPSEGRSMGILLILQCNDVSYDLMTNFSANIANWLTPERSSS